VLAEETPENAQTSVQVHARQQLKTAVVFDAGDVATALAGIIGEERVSAQARVFALDLLRDVEPPKGLNLVEPARVAYGSHSPAVRAAALPLYARADPVRVGGNDLAAMLDDKKLDKQMRAAEALAWGEVVSANRDAASRALDQLLKDETDDVRANAARAAGKLGRNYQERLIKMVKSENYGVRLGAADGLAASAEVGANAAYAVDGIAQLWREKGKPRRDAVVVWVHLAKKKPGAVVEYLAAAAKNTEDPLLHPLGIEGLCNAALAGSADARRALAKSIDDPSSEVRKIIMQCVAKGPDPVKNGAAIAVKLNKDPDGDIRANAARVLAAAAGKGGKAPAGVPEALVQMLADADRDVRLIAIGAIGQLGPDAPKDTAPALLRAFDHADDGERIALLQAARQVGVAELVNLAINASSPAVRVEAVETALAAGLNAQATLSAALADPDPSVRRAALERLAAQKESVNAAVRDRALLLAVRDGNPEISQLALTTIARVGPREDVLNRLRRALASRAERDRVQAAAAAIGLVERDPAQCAQLLEPLLDDPSHDVRVAMLPALAAAYTKTNTPDKLADLMTDSEDNAMRRLVAAAAFVTLAKTDAGRTASDAVLAKIGDGGPMLARATAKLTAGLVAGKADGMAFLQELVP
jgi:HEAT repeat protein